MLAVKHRHTDTPTRPAPRSSEPVRIVGAPTTARPSPPREMRAMLEARLASSDMAMPSIAMPTRVPLSPIAKIGVVTMLATLAWMPFAAAAYVFSL